jgi:basic amino acid/polyamine antiporter, APA family
MNVRANEIPPSPQRLKRGAIGPIGLAALAIGLLSPALGMYALWPPIQSLAGPIAPLVFACGMLIALPTAISYAVLNSEAPSAGCGSTWLWRALSPSAGYLLGLTMTTYLTIGAIAQPLIFGLFAQDLLAFLGYDIDGSATMFAAILVATVPVFWITRRGADTSVRTAVILMSFESMIVLALSLTILYVKGHQLGGIQFSPFNPVHATGGVAGFWSALILGVLGFAGFDVVSTAAEETNAPRRQIPAATLLAVSGVGVFWILNSWVYTLALPPSVIAEYTTKGMTAVTPMARHYWGPGNVLIILTAFTGITAIYISSVIASSRLIFALARHGLLPRSLAALHPLYRVPSRAMRAIFLLVVLASIVTILVLGNGIAGFLWWSNVQVFFLAMTFMGVNLANILYFRRVIRDRFRWGINFVIPVLGILINVGLLYEAFFKPLLVSDMEGGHSVFIFSVALMMLWVACVLVVRRFMPHRLQGEPPISVQ